MLFIKDYFIKLADKCDKFIFHICFFMLSVLIFSYLYIDLHNYIFRLFYCVTLWAAWVWKIAVDWTMIELVF